MLPLLHTSSFCYVRYIKMISSHIFRLCFGCEANSSFWGFCPYVCLCVCLVVLPGKLGTFRFLFWSAMSVVCGFLFRFEPVQIETVLLYSACFFVLLLQIRHPLLRTAERLHLLTVSVGIVIIVLRFSVLEFIGNYIVYTLGTSPYINLIEKPFVFFLLFLLPVHFYTYISFCTCCPLLYALLYRFANCARSLRLTVSLLRCC